MNASQEPNPSDQAHSRHYVILLSLAVLGVVYGDIGTSPLYSLRECFSHHYDIAPTRANILGILSLIFWSLILVVSIKYLVFILRADNKGEGGILALTALVIPQTKPGKFQKVLILLGLFGAAMLYGDGMITPAISVLGAVEGIGIATPVFEPYILPITCAILIALFLFQKGGTGRVGLVFGPVMLLWFVTLGILGISHLIWKPDVLWAVNPAYGVQFLGENGWTGFWVLGSVFLVVTGGEALYADLGHFGRRPIRSAWFSVVLPGLLLNYFGQGALLLRDPLAIDHPFYRMVPPILLYPLVLLSTLAAVIASQALISGSYSLTMQAVQLGFSPRMTIRHTSEKERGQIYLPFVNWTLMLACVGLVLGFKSSSNLAAAYGIAVTSTMAITTILFAVVAYLSWKWNLFAVILLTSTFLIIDLAFFLANAIKIPHGGWFPLVIAAAVFTMLTTWKSGRALVARRLARTTIPFDTFQKSIQHDPPTRVQGTAAFMYSNPIGTPPALLHNLKHNRVLHERTLIVNVATEQFPHVPRDERVQTEELGQGFYRVRIRYGFMDEPDIPNALRQIPDNVLQLNPMQITYFLGRENLIPSRKPGMALWREALFAWMSRNAQAATTYYRLPPNRVVELGAQIEL